MERNIALDLLKLSMAFMVVGLHAGFLGEFTSLGQYLTVNGVFRIAVPVFLLINGFYFHHILKNSGQLNWLKRVLILYAVWMIFYSYFWFSVPDISLVGLIKFTKDIIIGYHHLWYISGMFGAAIILIILRGCSSFTLATTALLSFLVGVLIQYIGNYHYFEGSVVDKLFNMHWFHRNMFFFSYPFFCIGYLIHKHSVHEKITLRNAGIMSALGMLALFGESYVNYHQNGRDGGFDNFLSLLFVCPFVFLLFMKFNIQGSSKNISLLSSAIYFIHSFFLSVLRKFFDLEATLLTLAAILLSIIASYAIIKINNRLKFIL
ncbi:acyltransferase family protein [Amphritea sp.]|uniref:acyltransferase family protein n=1 Tax=Amphritea sp. TaxID=1872502 RepID=UPI003A904AC7